MDEEEHVFFTRDPHWIEFHYQGKSSEDEEEHVSCMPTVNTLYDYES
jgi:hypothetical protein